MARALLANAGCAKDHSQPSCIDPCIAGSKCFSSPARRLIVQRYPCLRHRSTTVVDFLVALAMVTSAAITSSPDFRQENTAIRMGHARFRDRYQALVSGEKKIVFTPSVCSYEQVFYHSPWAWIWNTPKPSRPCCHQSSVVEHWYMSSLGCFYVASSLSPLDYFSVHGNYISG